MEINFPVVLLGASHFLVVGSFPVVTWLKPKGSFPVVSKLPSGKELRKISVGKELSNSKKLPNEKEASQ